MSSQHSPDRKPPPVHWVALEHLDIGSVRAYAKGSVVSDEVVKRFGFADRCRRCAPFDDTPATQQVGGQISDKTPAGE